MPTAASRSRRRARASFAAWRKRQVGPLHYRFPASRKFAGLYSLGELVPYLRDDMRWTRGQTAVDGARTRIFYRTREDQEMVVVIELMNQFILISIAAAEAAKSAGAGDWNPLRWIFSRP